MELQNNFDKCIVTADTACETAIQQGCPSTPATVYAVYTCTYLYTKGSSLL